MAEPDVISDFVFGRKLPTAGQDQALRQRAAPLERDLIDVFRQGVKAGAKGISSDVEYFKAGAQTLLGDTKGAAESIRDARALEQLAGLEMEGIEQFSEFLEAPTVEGFLTQVMSGTGQILPSAISSIGGAGAGAVAAVGARQLSGQTAKHLSKELIQDAAKATANGTADATQKRIAQGSYEALQEAYKKRQRSDLVKGGVAGAFASEYVPLTGSNVSEALDAGKTLDSDTAVRAGLVAIPQAAVGVLGEAGLVKLLQKSATKKTTGPDSVWEKIGKDFLKAGAVEGSAEAVQEEISIQNRVDLDPTYSEADQNLRRSQALFTGFFGGGALGGTGSAVGSSIAAVPDTVKKVVTESTNMMSNIKERVTNKAVADELDTPVGQTASEPKADIDAQLDAMFDDSSSKEAVWLANEKYNSALRDNVVTLVKVDGKDAYAAYIPGRGTIVARDVDIVQGVVDGSATDNVLAAALGYSSVKNAEDSLVVRVFNTQGNIVSEETTTLNNLKTAQAAATRLMPDGGSQDVVSVEEALIDRKQRGLSDTKLMEEEDFNSGAIDETDSIEFDPTSFEDQLTEGEFQVMRHTYRKNGEELDTYQAADPFNNNYEGIDQDRAEYSQAVDSDIDWTTPFYASMSQSMLKTAVKLKNIFTSEDVAIVKNGDGYSIDITTGFDSNLINITQDGKTKRLPLPMFLQASISKASQSISKFRTFSITNTETGKTTAVNPVDLANAGRRILEAETGQFQSDNTNKSYQQGMYRILTELQIAGYDVEVNGVPINEVLNQLSKNPKRPLPKEIKNVTVGFNSAGKSLDLGFLLKQYIPGRPEETLVETDAIDTELLDDDGVVIGKERANTGDPTLRTSSERRVITKEQQTDENLDAETVETTNIPLQAVLQQDSVLTALNVESPNRVYQSQSTTGRAPTTNTNPGPSAPGINFATGISFPFGDINEILSSFVQNLARKIKLKTPIAMIGTKGFDKALRVELAKLIKNKKSPEAKIAKRKLEGYKTKDGEVAPLDFSDKKAVSTFLNKLIDDGLLDQKALDIWNGSTQDKEFAVLAFAAYKAFTPLTNSTAVAVDLANTMVAKYSQKTTKGFFKSRYEGGHLIVIDDLRNKNEAGLAMVAAHEVGHALFKEEISRLEGTPLLKRLTKAFVEDRDAARDAGKPIPQWEAVGFEEWYADQVAAWIKESVNNDARNAKNAQDSYFKRVAAKFNKLWKNVSRHRIFQRQNNLKPAFFYYMKGVTKARRDNRLTILSPVYNDNGDIISYSSALGAMRLTEAPVQQTERAPEATSEATPDIASAPDTTAQPTNDPNTQEIPNEPSVEQRLVVKAIREQINEDIGGSDRVNLTKLQRWFSDFYDRMTRDYPGVTKALGLGLTADYMLELVGGREFADMFYIRSNTKAGLGFVSEYGRSRNKLRQKFFEILGADWSVESVQRAFAEAQSDIATDKLPEGKGKEIRLALEEIHKSYVSPSNTNINFRENYYPVFLELGAIAADPAKLEALIFKYDSNADPKAVRKAVKRLLKYQASVIKESDGLDITDIDIHATAADAEANIVLTKKIPREELEAAGFLQEPEVALLSYLNRLSRRVEWNRHTKDANGKNLLKDRLDAMTPEQREIAMSVLNSYLGNVTPLSPFWRKANSYLLTMNIVTLLPFATFASFPDFAGSIVNTKEFGGFAMFGKQVVEQMKDPQEARRLALDIGVVVPEAVANSWMSQADNDYLDPKVRQATDKFFSYTGLNFITNLSREVASGMAKRFLIEHANHPTSRSDRYLRQLGVTYDQVRAWEANDFKFDGPEGETVKNALVRFVESSVLRPNAAERPVWANDPRFALIWQLKTFLYSFNKVILEGLEREAIMRMGEYQGKSLSMMLGTSIAPIMLMTGAAFLPLAALGLELREYAKVGLSFALPTVDGSFKYLRTDKMDWGTYYSELFGRAGLDGPIGLLTMAQRNADWGGSAVATILGPTVELTERLLQDLPRIDKTVSSRMNSPQEQVGLIMGAGAFAPVAYDRAKSFAATLARAAT